MGPNGCECSRACLAQFEVFLLDLNAFLCSLNLRAKLLSVCPTYALLQSGHVSLYVPDLLYLSRVWGIGIGSFWRVLLVRNVILRSVFLKRFVIKVVSLPTYVKGANFCAVVSVFWLGVMVGCLGEGAMCVDRESIVQHDVMDSVQFFFVFVILQVVFNLLYRYIMAACLCWGGWFEEYGIMLSVKDGFLYMEVIQFVGVLRIVMSKKIIWLSDSGSAVNFMIGRSILKLSCMFFLCQCGGNHKLSRCRRHSENMQCCCFCQRDV